MVTDKVASLKACGAERVLTADCGCLFNIAGRAEHIDRAAGLARPSLPGEHIASFLWRRTNGEGR
jgi:L-lactate dehydrogenase complex protein LldE